MPLKNILLHMGNDEQHEARLAAAVAIARRFQATLDILYVATPASMPAGVTGRGASYAYLAEATAIAHEKAEEIEKRIRERITDVSFRWTVEEGDHVELLAKRTPYMDLAIVSQSHPAHLEDFVRLHLPDQLPMQASCPTLVLPWDHAAEIGTEMTIAWKECREAARAVRDALPFLLAARKVTVLTLDDSRASGREAGDSLVRFLEGHGMANVKRRHLGDDGGDAGETILAAAREDGSDALVMGAYGHSRLRELVVGGVTRHILGHMHLPVLMSH